MTLAHLISLRWNFFLIFIYLLKKILLFLAFRPVLLLQSVRSIHHHSLGLKVGKVFF